MNKKKEENPKKRDIFQDPSLSESLKLNEDPVVAFLGQRWKQIALIVALVFGIFYARNLFEDTHLRSMHTASNLYAQVRAEYGELLRLENQLELELLKESENSDAENLREEIGLYRERLYLSLSALNDAKEPYSKLANIYMGLLNSKASEATDTASVTTEPAFDSNWQKMRAGSSKRFFAELSALVQARSHLDTESYIEGRKALQLLAEDGQFVNITAAIALARVSSTDEERQEARNVLASLMLNHPEQTSLLEPEMLRLMS